MSVRILILACAAALAACGASEPAQAPQAPTAARREAPPRYVGLWAVSQAMCETPAWRFQAHEVATLGEVHCEFVDVAAVGDSYEISAMCTAEAPPAPYEIDLAVAEGPREMLVSGGPWAEPVRLIYCGPHPDE